MTGMVEKDQTALVYRWRAEQCLRRRASLKSSGRRCWSRPREIEQLTALLTSGDFDLDITNLNEAIRFNPKAVAAYNNRGAAWHQTGDFDRAIADYTEAIRLDPEHVFAHHNRGLARRMKGD